MSAVPSRSRRRVLLASVVGGVLLLAVIALVATLIAAPSEELEGARAQYQEARTALEDAQAAEQAAADDLATASDTALQESAEASDAVEASDGVLDEELVTGVATAADDAAEAAGSTAAATTTVVLESIDEGDVQALLDAAAQIQADTAAIAANTAAIQEDLDQLTAALDELESRLTALGETVATNAAELQAAHSELGSALRARLTDATDQVSRALESGDDLAVAIGSYATSAAEVGGRTPRR